MIHKVSLPVFLLDDNAANRRMYNYVLLRQGYTNIHMFEQTGDCLDHLALRPGIIFLNYLFDNKNGIEILKQIKGINPDILVLFISVQDNIKIAVDAIRLGAFEYIGKQDLSSEKIETVIKKTEPILLCNSCNSLHNCYLAGFN